MMRILATALIIFTNFILQSTLFTHIEFFGIRPNTTLIIVVSIAILRTDIDGAITGFFAGLLQDIVFGRAIGLNALLYMCIGALCGKPFKKFYRENYFLPIILVAVSTVFYEFSIFVVSFLFRGRLDMLFYIQRIILPSLAYNAFLAFPVYRIIYSINGALEKRESMGRRFY